MAMIYDFDFRRFNFTEDEWDEIPSGQKRLIRDYFLNGKDSVVTQMYRFDDTDCSVRLAVKRYALHNRPRLIVNLEEIEVVPIFR